MAIQAIHTINLKGRLCANLLLEDVDGLQYKDMHLVGSTHALLGQQSANSTAAYDSHE